MLFRLALVACTLGVLSLPVAASGASDGALDALIVKHAQANGVPEALVHRVVQRESRYNARAQHRGNYGLMQIKHGTARTMGYTGSASGLLDANTNLSYAVPYLAGAYRAAGGNQRRAMSLYIRGFHDVAKRQGTAARIGSATPAVASSQSQPEQKVAQASMPWF